MHPISGVYPPFACLLLLLQLQIELTTLSLFKGGKSQNVPILISQLSITLLDKEIQTSQKDIVEFVKCFHEMALNSKTDVNIGQVDKLTTRKDDKVARWYDAMLTMSNWYLHDIALHCTERKR